MNKHIKTKRTLMLYLAQLIYCSQLSHLPSVPMFTSRPPNTCQQHIVSVFNTAVLARSTRSVKQLLFIYYRRARRVMAKTLPGVDIFTQLPRCTSTGLTSSQSCSTGARHGPSPRPWLSALMPSTPGVCRKSFGSEISYTRHTTKYK